MSRAYSRAKIVPVRLGKEPAEAKGKSEGVTKEPVDSKLGVSDWGLRCFRFRLKHHQPYKSTLTLDPNFDQSMHRSDHGLINQSIIHNKAIRLTK